MATRRRADDEEEEELLTPFGAGGAPPAFTGGSTARARTARPSRTFEDLAAGNEAQREEILATLPPRSPFEPGSAMAYNQAAENLPLDSPTAVYNWGTGLYQLPGEEGRLGLWEPGDPRRYLGEVQGPFADPEAFQQALGIPMEETEAYGRAEVPGARARRFEEMAGAAGPGPEGIAFSENPAERSITLQPGTVRALLGTGSKVGAQVPTYISQQGGGAAADYIRGTQPQTYQQHQPEWWESGPLGTLLDFIPVIGGVKSMAQGLSKGNIFKTLAGIAGILGMAAGGQGGFPGAGGGEAGFDALTSPVGEAAGGFEGLTGGGVFAPTAPAPFPTGPAPFGTMASTVHPEAAGMSLGEIAPTAAEQAAGEGPFGMLDFGSAAPGAATGAFSRLTERLLPQTAGEAALKGTSEALGSLGDQFGGPSSPEMPTFGAQPEAGSAQPPAPPLGAAPTTQRAQTGAARVAGAGGPTEPQLPELGARPERPEELEERLRAQGFSRLAAGAAIPSFGTFR